MKRLAALGLAMLLAGCTPLQLLDALSPNWGYASVTTYAYGGEPRQALDVYRPKGDLRGVPVVVFFYGGRWTFFDKREFRFVGEALASKGYLAVLPDYRVYPDARFPAFVDDAAQALRWVRDHAREEGGDPDRIVVAGHSAGAHVATEAVLDQRHLERAGVPRSAIKGLVGMAGPYDFLPFRDADVRDIMGPEANWPATQPINFVDAGDPPMLLLYGLKDDVVWPHNARNLRDKAKEAGVAATLVEYPALDHYGLVAAMAAPLRLLGPVLDDVVGFVRRATI